MTSTRARPREGFSLGCAATDHNSTRRPCRASGYLSEEKFEALNAYAWYTHTTVSEIIVGLILPFLDQIEHSKQLTSQIVHLYQTTRYQ